MLLLRIYSGDFLYRSFRWNYSVHNIKNGAILYYNNLLHFSPILWGRLASLLSLLNIFQHQLIRQFFFFFKFRRPHYWIQQNFSLCPGQFRLDWYRKFVGKSKAQVSHIFRMLSNMYFSTFGTYKSFNSKLRIIMLASEITLILRSNEMNSAFTWLFFDLHTAAWSIIKQLANNSDMFAKSSFVHPYLKIGALHLEWQSPVWSIVNKPTAAPMFSSFPASDENSFNWRK
jgi:hypothetical protein